MDGTVNDFLGAEERRGRDSAPFVLGRSDDVRRAWSTGLGARLFDAALVALRDAGFEEVLLWVLEENMRARAFYERKGMTIDPSRPILLTVDGVDHHEIRYRSHLSG
jgi:ribosomal protein S18 acetylase RimI-like enzyme